MTPAAPLTHGFDVLIVGSGLAGLTAALHLAPLCKVAMLTKRSIHDSASSLAQGGIAAVLAADDHFDAHVDDTLVAGAGLCDTAATRLVVEQAPAAVAWLRRLGVPFSEEDGRLHLTREGGHSARRIVHATDATGAAVQRTLIAAVRRHPHITLFEDHMLIDLVTTTAPDAAHATALTPDEALRCTGLHALDERTATAVRFNAQHIILATGGAGQVYLQATSPDTATGDGIAAAWRAGCRVANMEFIQFHPTSLFHPGARSFLISEAVRGEGGRLLLPPAQGSTRFMASHDARGELAPRDVVTRGIDSEMKNHGADCVYRDISHQPGHFLSTHFPTIQARCLALGIDITKEPIPVVPAAHYTCGGILSSLAGRTDIGGLYAVGETACTGLHGANRLASNSLVECMVFAMAAAADIAARPTNDIATPARSREHTCEVSRTRARDGAEQRENHVEQKENVASEERQEKAVHPALPASATAARYRTELQSLMWQCVGIVRNDRQLAQAAGHIEQLQAAVQALQAQGSPARDLLELRNLIDVASLIVRSAQSRHESRGLHFNSDYPEIADTASPTILTPG